MSNELWIVCHLGVRAYGVLLNQVRGIVNCEDATKLPNTPEYLEFINIRGQLLPVTQLAKKF